MRLGLKQLRSLPVETQSGEVLGKVKDVIFDTDGHVILQYRVSSFFCPSPYTISKTQVVSIDAKRIVVEDSVKSIPTTSETRQLPPDPEPAIMTQVE